MEYEDKERESNYLSNLEKEITRECVAAGIAVTQDLVHHLIMLKELNPRNKFTTSEIMPRAKTQEFVRVCVKDLSEQSPAMDCLRLQSYWRSAIPKLAEEVKDTYYTHLMEKAEPAFQDVLQCEDKDKLLKKIALFTNLYTNVTGSNITQNLKETINPLKSVFKSADYLFYLALTEFGKFEYLKITARLVSGIRIYQNYYKKGSESIDNAPLLLPAAINAIRTDILNWIEKINRRWLMINSELLYLLEVLPGMEAPPLPEGFSEKDIDELVKIFAIMMQHDIYLKRLLHMLDVFAYFVHGLLTWFTTAMEALNATINNRGVIPAVEVYDQFINVCGYWSELQAEGCQLLYLGMVNKNMHNLNRYFSPTPLESALNIEEFDFGNFNSKKMSRKICRQVEGDDKGIVIGTLPDDEVLEFNGFCADCIYKRRGYLLPARPELGVIQYKGKWYGFFTADHADEWQEEVEANVYRAYEYVRCNPELVELLGMYDVLYSYRNETLIAHEGEAEGGARDIHVQTILHPVPEYIDKDYTFSVWQLKFRALQLSRIVKCLTKSVQTVNHSHFRSSIGIQCAPDKSEESATKKDVGSVHETLLNYLWGLRDVDESQFKVLNLTRPVDETYIRVLPTGDRPCTDMPCPPGPPCERPAPRKGKSGKTMAARMKELVAGAERGQYDFFQVMTEMQRLSSCDQLHS